MNLRDGLSSPYIFLLFFLAGTLVASWLLVFVAEGGWDRGVLGGPDTEVLGQELPNRTAALLAVSSSGSFLSLGEGQGTIPEDDASNIYLIRRGSVLSNSGAVLGGALTKQQGDLLTYKVQDGDNLSRIAAQFGISLNTILWANGGMKGNLIRPGDELTILPVSGVLHEVGPGDTLESIAAEYNVPETKIAKINRLDNLEGITAGKKLLIPDGKPLRTLASLLYTRARNLPALSGFFTFPVPRNSWNWGILHLDNAVDIANVCGTPIYAAADGLVIKTGNPARWNGGYGGYVVLEHQNGTETLYAHTQINFVDIGVVVEQGDTIAEIGSTGNVQGRTGCHVHFEVEGARNPFAK